MGQGEAREVRKWFSQREECPTSRQIGKIKVNLAVTANEYVGRSVSQTLEQKARKGLRGWPIATIAFCGPNLSQATKVAVGIVPSDNAAVEELRD